MKKMKNLRGIRFGAKRLMAGLLSIVLMGGLIPGTGTEAKAASWMDPYLETMVEWGAIKPDVNGNLHEYDQLTRADFVAMVNRAFGYTEMGPNPFSDVPDNAWYAEDIRIAHKAGYFNGTTATTASPNALVTREQAAVLLARNLRLQGVPGEVLNFSDSRQMGNWSRSLVQEAAKLGIIEGYADGTFRPKNPITRGQMSAFLVRALGTLIQEPGEHENKGVYHHLTISAPDVTLRNTTVTGNLYLAGGVGLENVTLENVTVQGRIVVAGGGEAQEGETSVVLRNVTAENLTVDSLTNQFLTLRSEGLTKIPETDVRTSAYVEDVTRNGLGLETIRFDGADGMKLQLAGNLKNVINLTPTSTLDIAQGEVGTLTVDEKALGSVLNIDGTAHIKELNLDVGTQVIGAGDISHTNVNAAGSLITMLPDTITVRPGITANVYGEVMDTAAAAESSADPRILSGYPKAQDVSPKAAQIAFSTNKKGTLYWAVTGLADGSATEAQLIKPSSSAKIIKSGTINVTASSTEVFAKLSGLTSDGSYYVAAVLEDNRGMRSPVKVTAFTTPDDTTPAFTEGYPKTILTEDEEGRIVLQAQVMANKACRLYYALMPDGATAPKPADFKAAAVSGNLGFGMEDLRKNTPFLISEVNVSRLKEQTTYDLYFWLTDVDGAKSSGVKKVEIKTPDKTPPKIQNLRVTSIAAKTIKLSFALDEPGTLYWAVVKQGNSFYSKEVQAALAENAFQAKQSNAAKMQIETAIGALKKGATRAAKALTDYTVTINGLEPQTAYDFYYVAKDTAGNYCMYTESMEMPMHIHTEDTEAPTVTQEFTHDGSESASKLEPYPDTSIRLVFSERVQGIQDVNGTLVYSDFYDLYQKKESGKLADALRKHIKLYYVPASGAVSEVPAYNGTNEDWVIQYEKATVTMDPQGTGGMIITFPYNPVKTESGLNLGSGATYYFDLLGIADTASNPNSMKVTPNTGGVTRLQKFTTIDAQIVFSDGTSQGMIERVKGDGTIEQVEVIFDMNFRITPITATSVADDIFWDMLFWSNNNITFELYSRELDDPIWKQVNTTTYQAGTTYAYDENAMAHINTTSSDPRLGVSMTAGLMSIHPDNPSFEQLNTLDKEREYGMVITKMGTSSLDERNNWSGTVSINVMAVSGNRGAMREMTKNLTPEDYQTHQESNLAVKEITVPAAGYPLAYTFRDKSAPTFTDNYPQFDTGDSGVSMDIMLSRPNTSFYYVIAEAGAIPTTFTDAQGVTHKSSDAPRIETVTDADGDPVLDGEGNPVQKLMNWFDYLPEDGEIFNGVPTGNVQVPGNDSITNPPYSEDTGKYLVGYADYSGGVMTVSESIGLKANMDYVAYFVLQGDSSSAISDVYAFHFKTKQVVRPVLTITSSGGTTGAAITANREAQMSYIVVVAGKQSNLLKKKMSDNCIDTTNQAWQDLTDAQRASYGGLTLLEAMRTSVRNADGSQVIGSVFDLYAAQDVKDQVVNEITEARTDGTAIIAAERDIALTNRKLTYTKDFSDELEGRGECWILAAGKSALGSGYAFSAYSYLYVSDDQHPRVKSYSTASMEITTNETIAASKAWSGTLYIDFDEPIFYRESAEEILQIVDCATIGNADPTQYRSSIGLITVPLQYKTNVGILHAYELPAGGSGAVNPKDFPPCQSLAIKFDKIPAGTTISFLTQLSDKDGNTAKGQDILSFKLGYVSTKGVDGTVFFKPEFKIVSGAWDATGNKK